MQAQQGPMTQMRPIRMRVGTHCHFLPVGQFSLDHAPVAGTVPFRGTQPDPGAIEAGTSMMPARRSRLSDVGGTTTSFPTPDGSQIHRIKSSLGAG